MPLVGIDVLLSGVRQKIHAIRLLLEEYERDLPDIAWQGFIRALKIITDGIDNFEEGAIKRCRSSFANDRRQLEDNCALYARTALGLLANLQLNYLPFLERGKKQSGNLPLAPIQRVASTLETSVQVALVPDFEYNYGYIGLESLVPKFIEPLRPELRTDQVEELESLAKSLAKWTVFLQYPVAENQSALNLCVLTHEFGHFVDHHEELYRKCLPIKLHEPSFRDLVERLRHTSLVAEPTAEQSQLTLETFYTREGLEADALSKCISFVQNWIRELIADILAVRAIGPAYFFALTEFFANSAGSNQPAPSHPAMANRLKLVLDELEDLGYFSGEANGAKQTLAESRALVAGEVPNTVHELYFLVAHKTIERDLVRIRETIKRFAAGFAFDAMRYRREIPPIVDSLLRGIAPIETLEPATGRRRPSSLAGILNAGWLVYRTRYSEFCSLRRTGVGTGKAFCA